MASATTDPLSLIEGDDEELGCYSRLYSSRARVLKPADVDELRSIFACARQTGRRVTLRSGGHSFDAQALGDDLVVSMSRFDSIEPLPEEGLVRVGPGATWGAILARLQPLGFVAAVTVTTEQATPGGTLSGDCLSRFSPAWGKEGTWVEGFDLLTTEGELLRCRAPENEEAGPAGWAREERAFSGVIGGLGYLGAVVSITYRMLPVGQTDGKVGVRTIVRTYETFEHLATDLVPTAKRTYLEDSDPDDPEKLDAIWSALHTRRDGKQTALFFTSAFTPDPERRRMPVHRPRLLLRIPVEWLMRKPALERLLWRIYLRMFEDGDEYVDDLEGYSFFMDGNARSKRVAAKLGFTLRGIQQTFVVPSDPGAEGGWDRAKNDLVEWLDRADGILRERKLSPTLHDVLFLPADKRFPLSASADLAGFAVSYAFETSNKKTLERAKETFAELADVLWDRFRGRVYLVKNVHARPDTLAAMYGGHAAEFFALKAELDPGAVLRNEFLERNFGRALARLETH